MERSKQNKHVVGKKDDNVDDGVDDGVKDGDDDSIDDGVEGADKYLTHLLQAVNCNFTQRSEQNELVVCNKYNDVDDSVEDGDDDGVEDGVDGADKHLTHLSQAVN
eukprot:1682249-Ditylum_brightwellii.AAC.1